MDLFCKFERSHVLTMGYLLERTVLSCFGLIQGFLKAIEESGMPACRIETCGLECLWSGNQHKGFLCAAGCGVKELTGKQRRWGVGQ